jgi:hypothetical protein
VEELGVEVVAEMPLLAELQNMVISLPSISAFIKSQNYSLWAGTIMQHRFPSFLFFLP